MTNGTDGKILLAIESAIEGGSLSLFRGTSEVGSHVGAAGVSRAEDLLVDINELLRSHGLAPRDLQVVAASAGPGSFTGLRIGLATALGLARGSGATFASASLLSACAEAYLSRGEGVVVVPVGRGSVAFQSFTSTIEGITVLAQPRIVAADSLMDNIEQAANARLLLHSSLARLAASDERIELIGPNLAYAVGLSCGANPTVAEPIFLSKS